MLYIRPFPWKPSEITTKNRSRLLRASKTTSNSDLETALWTLSFLKVSYVSRLPHLLPCLLSKFWFRNLEESCVVFWFQYSIPVVLCYCKIPFGQSKVVRLLLWTCENSPFVPTYKSSRVSRAHECIWLAVLVYSKGLSSNLMFHATNDTSKRGYQNKKYVEKIEYHIYCYTSN